MKGQWLTIESIFFFAMGVSMCIIVFFTFLSMGDILKKDNMKSQLEKVGENIRTNIMKVFVSGNSTNSSIKLDIDVPREISGCVYQIEIKDGLDIRCTDGLTGGTLNLYGIKTKIKNRVAYSSGEKISISYKNGEIELDNA